MKGSSTIRHSWQGGGESLWKSAEPSEYSGTHVEAVTAVHEARRTLKGQATSESIRKKKDRSRMRSETKLRCLPGEEGKEMEPFKKNDMRHLS